MSTETSAMADPDLQTLHDLLIDIALRAGTMITSAHPSTSTSGTKINSADLITATDKEVETMVFTNLKARYPTYEFLGEETYSPGTPLTPSPTFICDPIDGTMNFVHGDPHVCISLAFASNLVPLVGVVYNPFLHQLYHGIKGHGAFLTMVYPFPPPSATVTPASPSESPRPQFTNSRRLPLRSLEPLPPLSQALLAVEWGNERSGPNYLIKTSTFHALTSAAPGGAMIHGLRSIGSSALNICAVAAGSLDAYWEGGCWAWDVAAAWVLLHEAGGRMVGGNVGDWSPRVDGRVYLAVRGGSIEAEEEEREERVRRFVEGFWGKIKGRLEYKL